MNCHLIGEKNGKETGMMLNIVARNVEEIKKGYCIVNLANTALWSDS